MTLRAAARDLRLGVQVMHTAYPGHIFRVVGTPVIYSDYPYVPVEEVARGILRWHAWISKLSLAYPLAVQVPEGM